MGIVGEEPESIMPYGTSFSIRVIETDVIRNARLWSGSTYAERSTELTATAVPVESCGEAEMRIQFFPLGWAIKTDLKSPINILSIYYLYLLIRSKEM